jgi:hypothetical protein
MHLHGPGRTESWNGGRKNAAQLKAKVKAALQLPPPYAATLLGAKPRRALAHCCCFDLAAHKVVVVRGEEAAAFTRSEIRDVMFHAL